MGGGGVEDMAAFLSLRLRGSGYVLIILKWSLLVSLRFVWFHLWFRAGLMVASLRFAWF